MEGWSHEIYLGRFYVVARGDFNGNRNDILAVVNPKGFMAMRLIDTLIPWLLSFAILGALACEALSG